MKTDDPKPTRLRILMLGNVAPYRLGGTEVQMRRLADGFHRCGHDVSVAGYAMPDAMQGQTHAWTSVHLPVSGGSRWRRAISFATALGRFLIRNGRNYDVIYGRVLGESILVAAALKYLGLIIQPIVACSACSGQYGDATNLARLPASKLLVHVLNRSCSAVNILSPAIAQELEFTGLNPNLFTSIPNGVPLVNTPGVSQRNLAAPRSFLYVGRLSPQKRVDLLIRAVSQLTQKNQCVDLHIIGDGPERQGLSALAERLGIDRQVIFHGRIDPVEVAPFYAEHSIFLMSSRNEGQPNALLEAMAHAMPAIVSASGGAEYLVDQSSGIICPPGDSEAIAAAMAQLLALPAKHLADMGACARRRVQAKHDLALVVEQYLNLFNQLT